ncbi:hypothetical protein Holit_02452 [Hollandina sp. SP2]
MRRLEELANHLLPGVLEVDDVQPLPPGPQPLLLRYIIPSQKPLIGRRDGHRPSASSLFILGSINKVGIGVGIVEQGIEGVVYRRQRILVGIAGIAQGLAYHVPVFLFPITGVVFVARAGPGKGDFPRFIPGFHGGIDKLPVIVAVDALQRDGEGCIDLIHGFPDPAMDLVLEHPFLSPLGGDVGTVKVKSDRRSANSPETLPPLCATVSISQKTGDCSSQGQHACTGIWFIRSEPGLVLGRPFRWCFFRSPLSIPSTVKWLT